MGTIEKRLELYKTALKDWGNNHKDTCFGFCWYFDTKFNYIYDYDFKLQFKELYQFSTHRSETSLYYWSNRGERIEALLKAIEYCELIILGKQIKLAILNKQQHNKKALLGYIELTGKFDSIDIWKRMDRSSLVKYLHSLLDNPEHVEKIAKLFNTFKL